MLNDVSVRAFQAEAAMRMLLAEAELPEPDEIEHDLDNEEIVLRWNEPKLAVVIELDDRGPDNLNVPDCPV